MATPEKNSTKDNTTVRLLELVNDLSLEQQRILLDQLIKDNITATLNKLIIDRPADQQVSLLKKLESLRTKGERKQPRKSCKITVSYAKYLPDQRRFDVSSNYIQDISTGGAFIDTSDLLGIGQELLLSFAANDSQKPHKITAEIIRCTSQGIGVKFKDLTEQQKEMIASLMEEL
jgi:Tfp pilus assembly protein PilZ